jgi:CelD/BcsL family acetyltransferase involved in cellulose biosynthesis
VTALSEAPQVEKPETVALDARAASKLSLQDPRWLSFVERHPRALIFHHPAWADMIGSTYGYQRFALCVLDGDRQVAGGLPVIEIRGLRRQRRWVSLPFSDLCPPLLSEHLEAESFTMALEQARLDARVRSLQVRAELAGADRYQGSEAVIHTTSLERDVDALFQTFHRSQVQRNLRRAEREQLVVRVGSDQEDLTRSFYGLHVQTRRRLGMPVQPRRFFSAIWEQLLEQGHGWLLLVESDSRPVAAAVFLTSPAKQTVTYKYGASDSAFWSKRPNHLLFAHAIRLACEQGYRQFDWGRSDLPDAGLREFKNGWAGVEEPLLYTTLVDGEPAAEGSGRALNAARAALSHSPAWVCRVSGEMFYRYAA